MATARWAVLIGRLALHGNSYFAYWIATIDEQPAAGHERSAKSLQRLGPSVRVPPVKRSDPHCERDVVPCLARLEFESLSRDMTGSQPSSRDQIGRGLGQLCDRPRRPVDGEDVPRRTDALGDRARRRTRAAADLDDAEAGTKGQSVDDRCEARRQRRHSRHRRSHIDHAIDRLLTCPRGAGRGVGGVTASPKPVPERHLSSR